MVFYYPDIEKLNIFKVVIFKFLKNNKAEISTKESIKYIDANLNKTGIAPNLKSVYMSLVPALLGSILMDPIAGKNLKGLSDLEYARLSKDIINLKKQHSSSESSNSNELSPEFIDAVDKYFKDYISGKYDNQQQPANVQIPKAPIGPIGGLDAFLDKAIIFAPEVNNRTSKHQVFPLTSTISNQDKDGDNAQRTIRFRNTMTQLRNVAVANGTIVADGNTLRGDFKSITLGGKNGVDSSVGIRIKFMKDSELTDQYGQIIHSTKYNDEHPYKAFDNGVVGVLVNNKGEVLAFDNDGNFKGIAQPNISPSEIESKGLPILLYVRNVQKKMDMVGQIKYTEVFNEEYLNNSLAVLTDKNDIAQQNAELKELYELRQAVNNGETRVTNLDMISLGVINQDYGTKLESVEHYNVGSTMSNNNKIQLSFGKNGPFLSSEGQVAYAGIAPHTVGDIADNKLKEDVLNLFRQILIDPSLVKDERIVGDRADGDGRYNRIDITGYRNMFRIFHDLSRVYKLKQIEQLNDNLDILKSFDTVLLVYNKLDFIGDITLWLYHKQQNGKIVKIHLSRLDDYEEELSKEERTKIVDEMMKYIPKLQLNITKDYFNGRKVYIRPDRVLDFYKSIKNINEKIKDIDDDQKMKNFAKTSESNYNDFITKAGFWTPVSPIQFKMGGDNAWVHFNIDGRVYETQESKQKTKSFIDLAIRNSANYHLPKSSSPSYDSKDGKEKILRQSNLSKDIAIDIIEKDKIEKLKNPKFDDEGNEITETRSSKTIVHARQSARIGKFMDAMMRSIVSAPLNSSPFEIFGDGNVDYEGYNYIINIKTNNDADEFIKVDPDFFRNVHIKLCKIYDYIQRTGWKVVSKPLLLRSFKSFHAKDEKGLTQNYNGFGCKINLLLTKMDPNGTTLYQIMNIKTMNMPFGNEEANTNSKVYNKASVVEYFDGYSGKINRNLNYWRKQLYLYKILAELMSRSDRPDNPIIISKLSVIPIRTIFNSGFEEGQLADENNIPIPTLMNNFYKNEHNKDVEYFDDINGKVFPIYNSLSNDEDRKQKSGEKYAYLLQELKNKGIIANDEYDYLKGRNEAE